MSLGSDEASPFPFGDRSTHTLRLPAFAHCLACSSTGSVAFFLKAEIE